MTNHSRRRLKPNPASPARHSRTHVGAPGQGSPGLNQAPGIRPLPANETRCLSSLLLAVGAGGAGGGCAGGCLAGELVAASRLRHLTALGELRERGADRPAAQPGRSRDSPAVIALPPASASRTVFFVAPGAVRAAPRARRAVGVLAGDSAGSGEEVLAAALAREPAGLRVAVREAAAGRDRRPAGSGAAVGAALPDGVAWRSREPRAASAWRSLSASPSSSSRWA